MHNLEKNISDAVVERSEEEDSADCKNTEDPEPVTDKNYSEVVKEEEYEG